MMISTSMPKEKSDDDIGYYGTVLDSADMRWF